MFLWLLLAVAIIIFDQITKYLVVNNIGLTDSIKVIPQVLDFVYVKNKGAAFSFLADRNYGIILLSLISLIFCIGVLIYILTNINVIIIEYINLLAIIPFFKISPYFYYILISPINISFIFIIFTF